MVSLFFPLIVHVDGIRAGGVVHELAVLGAGQLELVPDEAVGAAALDVADDKVHLGPGLDAARLGRVEGPTAWG